MTMIAGMISERKGLYSKAQVPIFTLALWPQRRSFLQAAIIHVENEELYLMIVKI